MQRTVRFLRVALPIAFVAFVLVIVFSWTRTHATRDRGSSESVPTTRTGEKPLVVSHTFEDTQTIGGRVVSHITAKRVIAYQSSWNTLEDVALTIYRPNGLTYDLRCPQAQFNSETKEAEVKGGVRLISSDGVVIQTAALHFDGNRLTNHIPVQFTVDRWNGNAGALDLDVAAETLHLFEHMTAATTPSPTEPSMSLKAVDSLFRRKESNVEFTGAAEMTRAADRIDGEQIVGRFTPDHKTLTGLEGHGKVMMNLSSAANPGEDLGGRKVIYCDRFYSEVAPGGGINAINAVGDTAPAHAVLDGPPKRDITCKQFRVELVNRAVNELKAEQNVVMKELGPAPREITTDHVTISFEQQTHKATSAFLDGNFRYTDPKNQATALRANYDITGDRVLLTAEPGFDPTVTSEGNIVKAHQIEFSPHAGTARATGAVIAQLVSRSGVAADSTNLFPAGKPVFVNSDLLVMRQTGKTALFTGNVKAWQDTNTLFAQELQVQGNGDSIQARGGVRTTLYNSPSGAARKSPVLSQSDTLNGRKNDRRLDLNGNVKMDDESRSMTSEHATFFFDANKKIERMEADGKVVMVDPSQGRRATADKAIYHVETKIADLTGKPATSTDPKGTVSGDQISIDTLHNKVQITKASGTYKEQ
jgi:LPS export ABC transporter protein LptC/lipopolysaccharide transport protein LptA